MAPAVASAPAPALGPIPSRLLRVRNFRPVQPRQSSLKISLEDLNRLEKYLDDRDLPGAYGVFEEAAASEKKEDSQAPKGSVALVQDEQIKPVLELLLEGLTAEGAQYPNLPSPTDFIENLRVLGVASDSQYRLLLTSLLQQGKSPEEVAPVLNSAIEFFKEDVGPRPSAVAPEEEEDTADREFHILWSSLRLGFKSANSPTPIASTIYLSFLHTMDIGGELHKMLEKVLLFGFSNTPNIGFLGRYMDHHSFDPEVQKRLLLLTRKFEFQKHLAVPALLLQAVARCTDTESLKTYYDSIEVDSKETGVALSEENYMVFVMAFMALRDTETAIEVWNKMPAGGIIPGPRSWSKILFECSKFPDNAKSALLKVWQHMIASGVVPDRILWTNRIHSLLLSNNKPAGMESLNMMIKSGVAPSTATINAVIDGLLKHLNLKEARAVLETAAKMGIKSNLQTFNTLLRAYLKAKEFKEAITLLQRMQKTGVQADVVTATTVLNGIYRDVPKKPDIEQIRMILDQMQAAGVMANEVTYTAILEGLLANGNEGAAQDIWKVMEQKGIKPNTITYSIVIKYAFQKGDLGGVARLRTQLEASGVAPDTRLWSILAVGYARTGEIGAMVQVLAAMEAAGRSLPLTGYNSILRELEMRSLFDLARELVECVISMDLVSRDGTVAGNREKIFWEILERMGGGSVLAQLKESGVIVK